MWISGSFSPLTVLRRGLDLVAMWISGSFSPLTVPRRGPGLVPMRGIWTSSLMARVGCAAVRHAV